jgi:hypothetical protein
MNNNAIANKKDIIFYLQSLKGGQGINEYNKYILKYYYQRIFKIKIYFKK